MELDGDWPSISGTWNNEVEQPWQTAHSHPWRWDATGDLEHVYSFDKLDEGPLRLVWDGLPGREFDGIVGQTDGALWVRDPGDQRIAYYGQRGEGVFVGVGGDQQPDLQGLAKLVPLTFSPDGRHLAYGAYIDRAIRLIVDGVVHSDRNVAPVAPVWAPNGERLAFVAQSRELQPGEQPLDFQQWVVLDGQDLPKADWIARHAGGIRFSPDGRRFAYDEVIGGKVRLVVDGSAEPFISDFSEAAFSPDGGRFAYSAQLVGRWTLVTDGHPGESYDEVGPPIFSPDGSRLLFVARRDKRWSVVVDGSPGPEFQDLKLMPSFSPDGRRVAYLGRRRGRGLLGAVAPRWVAVVDGRELALGEWDDVGSEVTYSPDSAHFAFAARRGRTWSVVVDGQPGRSFDEPVGPPRWGTTGRLAYVAVDGPDTTVVCDEKPGPWCTGILQPRPGPFWFSPSGRHLAWIGKYEGAWRPIVDDMIGPGGLGASTPRFGQEKVEFITWQADGAHRVWAKLALEP
jgi:hypothetical protein